MLAALYAGAQQLSQPKSNDQPTQPQSALQPAQPKSDNTAQPPAATNAQPSNTSAAPDRNAASEKDSAKAPAATAPAAAPVASKGCLAVKPIGSHAFRNVMLLGVTGALISKQQYQVMDAVNYPVSVGTKFHGDDLQTITSNGTKVIILDKHYKEEDLQRACR
jgi:hypothetical protein